MGCGSSPDDVVCTADLAPGIVVEIRDANSDMPLAENALVIITDGDFREALLITGYEGSDSSSAVTVSGALERAGIYDISVTLIGYKDWSRSGVEVTSGVCHVGTIIFIARLERL